MKRATDGEREVLGIVLKELRRAMRQKRPHRLELVFDPWIPKGCRGLTILVSVDPAERRYEVDGVGT